jgi:hypothetical protein
MNYVNESRLAFDLSRPPRLGEPRLERAIKAQDDLLSLAGNRLNPVVLLPGRGLGPEKTQTEPSVLIRSPLV